MNKLSLIFAFWLSNAFIIMSNKANTRVYNYYNLTLIKFVCFCLMINIVLFSESLIIFLAVHFHVMYLGAKCLFYFTLFRAPDFSSSRSIFNIRTIQCHSWFFTTYSFFLRSDILLFQVFCRIIRRTKIKWKL